MAHDDEDKRATEPSQSAIEPIVLKIELEDPTDAVAFLRAVAELIAKPGVRKLTIIAE